MTHPLNTTNKTAKDLLLLEIIPGSENTDPNLIGYTDYSIFSVDGIRMSI
jgi:hypothetical protein